MPQAEYVSTKLANYAKMNPAKCAYCRHLTEYRTSLSLPTHYSIKHPTYVVLFRPSAMRGDNLSNRHSGCAADRYYRDRAKREKIHRATKGIEFDG